MSTQLSQLLMPNLLGQSMGAGTVMLMVYFFRNANFKNKDKNLTDSKAGFPVSGRHLGKKKTNKTDL